MLSNRWQYSGLNQPIETHEYCSQLLCRRCRRHRPLHIQARRDVFSDSYCCGLLGLVVPWFFLIASRKAASICAAALSLTASIAFVVAEITMPKGGDMIRIDIVIFPPLLGLDWLVFLVLVVAAAVGSPPVEPKDE